MPGAFEGETVNRRRFMGMVTHSAGGVAAAAFTLPALGFALGPLFSRVPFNWQPIGPPADFSESTYTTKVLTIVQGIGEAGYSIAYVRKRDPEHRQGARRPVQPLGRALLALHAPRLPRPLRRRRPAIHLSVPRRGL